MKKIKVRDIILGEGKTKICVSITGKNEKEALIQAEKIALSKADVVELRLDYLENFFVYKKKEKLRGLLSKIREVLENMPLIFTVRSEKEGGNIDVSQSDYLLINRNAIESGFIDIIDIQFMQGKETLQILLKCSRDFDVKTIISYHNFEKRFHAFEMEEILEKMKNLGGDIPKIAFMPQDKIDVANLCLAASKFHEKRKAPFIAISMGELGMISRYALKSFGSVMSFASLEDEGGSAPGQIAVDKLYKIINLVES